MRKLAVSPDPKPAARVSDPVLLSGLHRLWWSCFLCDALRGGGVRLSLHHVHKHPRDDVRENLVMLCGDGTSGCHGLIEHADRQARQRLARMIRIERPDTFGYLAQKLGSAVAADEWLRRYAVGKENP